VLDGRGPSKPTVNERMDKLGVILGIGSCVVIVLVAAGVSGFVDTTTTMWGIGIGVIGMFAIALPWGLIEFFRQPNLGDAKRDQVRSDTSEMELNEHSICFNCFRTLDKELGYSRWSESLSKDYWICYECSRCVVCGVKGGQELRGFGLPYPTPTRTKVIFPTVIFYCKEHEQMYFDSVGIPMGQQPRDLLGHFLEYLDYQREMLIKVDTPQSIQRLQMVNGLKLAYSRAIVGQPIPQGGAVIKEIIKETVKIPCRYCGTLVLITDSNCSKCGAPLR